VNTPQQTAIISRFAAGASFAVRARAGTGKTTTLVEAFQRAPEGSLALAFNKRIAEELAIRMPKHVESRTMNGIGHRAWGDRLRKTLRVDTKKLLSLWDTSPWKKELPEEGLAICRLVSLAKSHGFASGFGGSTHENDFAWIDLADRFDILDGEALVPAAKWLLDESCRTAFNGLIDFDDQIYMSVRYDAPFPKYRCIAADEAQDLSALQHEMVRRLSGANAQHLIVGDPAQAIYGFRGASENSFSELCQAFSLDVLPLTVSFRCPQSIIGEAQKYVPDIEASSAAKPGSVVIARGISPQRNRTVLSRTNAPLIKLAFQAIRETIPVNYLGRDFLSGLRALHKRYPTQRALDSWYAAEKAKAKSKGALARLADRYESMCILHERFGEKLEPAFKQLFDTSTGAMTLSTIHKAKGLEWANVAYLDYDKIWDGAQESNIKYVGVTRAQDTLTLQMKES
jgi:superfamily I DNA/RNA helicase